jgi:hypothetical protein
MQLDSERDLGCSPAEGYSKPYDCSCTCATSEKRTTANRPDQRRALVAPIPRWLCPPLLLINIPPYGRLVLLYPPLPAMFALSAALVLLAVQSASAASLKLNSAFQGQSFFDGASQPPRAPARPQFSAQASASTPRSPTPPTTASSSASCARPPVRPRADLTRPTAMRTSPSRSRRRRRSPLSTRRPTTSSSASTTSTTTRARAPFRSLAATRS